MPTKKPRVTFTISEEQLALVEEFQFSNKIKNQTQAILKLLERGLEDFPQEFSPDTKKSPSLENGDEELLNLYHRLDRDDRSAIKYEIRGMLLTEKYRKDEQPGISAG